MYKSRICEDALFHKDSAYDICFYAQNKTIKYLCLGVLVLDFVESLEKSEKARPRLYFPIPYGSVFSMGKQAENFGRFV